MPLVSFTDHPHSVGETYRQHLGSAWSFSAAMAGGALCCFLHGIFPFLCTTTGSSTIRRLHERMVVHRVRTTPEPALRRT